MAGMLIFRSAIVIPGTLAFQCISVGAALAGILSLVRLSRHGYALTIIAVFGVLRLGWVESRGWMVGISGFLLAGGLYLCAIIFDLLGRRGMMIGKFLIARLARELHYAANQLTPPGVGQADHSAIFHGRVATYHLFHFLGRDVFPTADDNVLLAIDDVEIALGVKTADIPGV